MKITPIPPPNILDDEPQKPTTIKEVNSAVDTLPTLLQSIFDIMIEMEGNANDSPAESAD